MEKRRVVITGLGTVNPLGNNVADSWAAARAGKCGIGPITQFDTTDFKCKLAGEVKDFDPETVVDKKEVRKMARFTLLALGAAAEAIADSGIDTEAEGKNIGVILSSGIGGLPTIEEQHARGEEKGMEKVSPYFVPMAIANMAAAQVAIRFGLKGMCTCPVTACAGGTNAVGDAFHRIRDGYEPVMVCGGAESCISPLGIGGFTSMKALSTATDRTLPACPLTPAAAALSWARAAVCWCWRSWNTQKRAAHTSTPRWWAMVPTAMPTTLPHRLPAAWAPSTA